jgi:multisubunit Na+/H+ antiporter MnhC subunit
MNQAFFGSIGIFHYLTVSSLLFTIGICGIFLNRKNIITILMSIELILLSVNINFVAFSVALGDLTGQIFACSCSRLPPPKRPSALPFSSSTSATAAPSRWKTSI